MKNITLKSFNSALKDIGTEGDIMAIVAGYIIQQGMLHKNIDAAKQALSNKALLDSRTGKLNKRGSQLRDYILAHCRYIQIEYKDNALAIKLKVKASDLERNHLVNVEATRTKGERVYQAQPIAETGAILLDFKVFTDYSAPKTKDKPAPFTVAQINARLKTLCEAITERGISALPAELEQALTEVDTLQKTLLTAIASSSAPDIETSALDSFDSIAPTGASKAAPKKRAKK